MKKMTVLAIMVGVLVLAMAAPALAIGPAYIDWAAGGNNAGTGGPHQNYTLTTEKCAVCHSVHAAAASNAAAGVFGPDATTGAQTEMLLRSSVADACTYCHITSNVAGLQIYNGVASNYSTDDVYGHNGSDHAECADCHAVHGADTFGGYIAGKILKANGETVGNNSDEVQTEAAATLNAAVTGGDVFATTVAAEGDLQVTAFCTRCHKTFSDASETTVTASGYFSDYSGTVSYGPMSFKNHPLKAAEASFEASGSNFTGTVAWADAETCRSCHAAGSTRRSTSYGGPGGLVAWSFPHHTPGNSNFLVAGSDLGDANIGIDNTSIIKPAGSNVVDSAHADGVCLRCHDNGAGAGVNDTF